ncbi:MAG: galactokinase [Mycobacteriaceae bacterium]
MTDTPNFLPANDLAERTAADATRVFGGRPAGVWAAPGRVNLIGEHTDYNAGFCLPVALAHRTWVAATPRDDDRVRITSRQTDQSFTGRVGEIGKGWTAYPTGVLWALREAGYPVAGVDLRVDSTVPVGSGLSSSAALTCAVALAVTPQDASRRELVAACIRAENEAAGAPTGGMDQSAALLSRAGTALLLDCRDGSTEHLPLDLDGAGLELLVIDTRAHHSLADGQYAARRADCEAAATALGVSTLREADLDAVAGLSDPQQRARARHVVTEIARAREFAELLRAGRLGETGPLLDASHTSLAGDYDVSCDELDLAVEAARGHGALGARMTGGGFGGSAIALVTAGRASSVAAGVDAAFAARSLRPPGFLLAEPSGAGSRVR